jgi:hypothetical protein
METAVGEIARDRPDDFAPIADRLKERQFETAQYLLMRAWAANGARFADAAVDYLLEGSGRLETGYMESKRWAARQLIEAVTPYCSDDHLVRLERILLDYYPAWERSVDGRKAHGYAQLVLLEGTAEGRRSPDVVRRLGELRRKFGAVTGEPTATPRMAEWVGPPIPATAAEKMNDDQWLRAISRYRGDRDAVRDGRLVGGAHELSQLLEAQTKADPARFAALAERIPDDAHPYYFDAILRGVADAGLDVAGIVRLCRRCHALPRRPCGRWITRPIARIAGEALPQDALEIVAWYATEDPDPDQELWRTPAVGGTPYYGGDIRMAAINSVRGSAAETVAGLIFADRERLAFFGPVLERMVRDPSPAVRCCVAAALVAVLRYDRDLAVRLFLTLSEIDEDRVLGTHDAERFLAFGLRTHFHQLSPVVARMLRSPIADVATAGARQACIATLVLPEARALASRCLRGTEAQRHGAAQVFAANLAEAPLRAFCEDALGKLFYDANLGGHLKTGHTWTGQIRP